AVNFVKDILEFNARSEYLELGSYLAKSLEYIFIMATTWCSSGAIAKGLQRVVSAMTVAKFSPLDSPSTPYTSTDPDIEDLIQNTRPQIPRNEHVPKYKVPSWVDRMIARNSPSSPPEGGAGIPSAPQAPTGEGIVTQTAPTTTTRAINS